MFSPDVAKVSFKVAKFGVYKEQKIVGAMISKEEFMLLRCDLLYCLADRTNDFSYTIKMFSPHNMEVTNGMRMIHFESIDPFILRQEIIIILKEYDFESKPLLEQIKQAIDHSLALTSFVNVEYA